MQMFLSDSLWNRAIVMSLRKVDLEYAIIISGRGRLFSQKKLPEIKLGYQKDKMIF